MNHTDAGLKLGWDSSSLYATDVPSGYRDVSGYEVLSLRIAETATQYPPIVSPGPTVNLYINIEDGSGRTAIKDLRTDNYADIPHPADTAPSDWYETSFKCAAYGFAINRSQLSTVRIPLVDFTLHDSGVDLTDIIKVSIWTEGSEVIAVDDIEFGN